MVIRIKPGACIAANFLNSTRNRVIAKLDLEIVESVFNLVPGAVAAFGNIFPFVIVKLLS
ncbi:hypothetical protein A0256_03435 [Mucilaginibacter sp. PAMC 26640]|nr:hypothetical protein A0256_03435 [Mucilaginibacter sp. PAMC 26640]